MNTRLKTKEGSVVIEALLILTGTFSFFVMGLFLIYLSFLSLWIQHNLYEGLICLSYHPSYMSLCRKKVIEKLEPFLPRRNLLSLQLKKEPLMLKAFLEVSFFQWRIHQKVFLKKEEVMFSLRIPEALF